MPTRDRRIETVRELQKLNNGCIQQIKFFLRKRKKRIQINAGRQDKGRPAPFQAEDGGVGLSLPAQKGFICTINVKSLNAMLDVLCALNLDGEGILNQRKEFPIYEMMIEKKQKELLWPVSLMVELRLYTAVTAVRFCHGLPKLL